MVKRASSDSRVHGRGNNCWEPTISDSPCSSIVRRAARAPHVALATLRGLGLASRALEDTRYERGMSQSAVRDMMLKYPWVKNRNTILRLMSRMFPFAKLWGHKRRRNHILVSTLGRKLEEGRQNYAIIGRHMHNLQITPNVHR